jgi:hypothetical protein
MGTSAFFRQSFPYALHRFVVIERLITACVKTASSPTVGEPACDILAISGTAGGQVQCKAGSVMKSAQASQPSPAFGPLGRMHCQAAIVGLGLESIYRVETKVVVLIITAH